MNFQSSLKTCFNKYASFKGRASRSEFWYFYLFAYATIFLIIFLFPDLDGSGDTAFILALIFSLVTICPLVAVTARRLHDGGRSGWWQLISAVPFVGIIGVIFLLIWWCTEGEKKKNKFGPPIKLKK